MHAGAVGNIGALKPQNYRHVVFNNGAHESVGGQPTVGFEVDIPAIAKACGYVEVYRAENEMEIRDAMRRMEEAEGPALLEIRVGTGSREDLGRPTSTPVENKAAFMEFLNR